MKKKTIEREIYIDNWFKGLLCKKISAASTIQYISLEKGLGDCNYRAKITFEVEEEPLTFERIKKECVPMETLLEYRGGKRLYLGFNRNGQLVTDNQIGTGASVWSETGIKDWGIYNE